MVQESNMIHHMRKSAFSKLQIKKERKKFTNANNLRERYQLLNDFLYHQ